MENVATSHLMSTSAIDQSLSQGTHMQTFVPLCTDEQQQGASFPTTGFGSCGRLFSAQWAVTKMGFRSSGVVLGLLGFGNNGCQDSDRSQEGQVGDIQQPSLGDPGLASAGMGRKTCPQQACRGSVDRSSVGQPTGSSQRMKTTFCLLPEGLFSSIHDSAPPPSSAAFWLSLLDVFQPAQPGFRSPVPPQEDISISSVLLL